MHTTHQPTGRPARRRVWCGWALALLAAPGLAQTQAVSEADYFAEVPAVLTVTRLSQPLSDTPGAVTVIDRDTIRRLGARDLVDVLRQVPGYLVSGYNGANQVGAYHAPVDEYGTRNLILVDGRSIYSSTYLGGTMRSVSAIHLNDVERIEVLRGSNSAAYGANALFGVINVITRHAVDSNGAALQLNQGGQGLQDVYARWGWGEMDRNHRLSVAQRRDDGYGNIDDSRRLYNLAWRTDARPDARSELALTGGLTQLVADEGFPGRTGNPLREIATHNAYLHGRWSRELSPVDTVKVSLSWDRDRTRDRFAYRVSNPLLDGTLVDQGSVEERWQFEVQQQHVASGTWRWVLGAGYHDTRGRSRALFATDDDVRMWDARVFGHAEWRLAPDWLLNLGLFAGHNSDSGHYALPRLALNHRLNDAHTLRFSAGQAMRQLTLFERHGNRQFFNPAGMLVATGYQAQPGLPPERLHVWEAGHHGTWLPGRLTSDVRVFRESMRDYFDIVNDQAQLRPGGFDVQGVEWQVDWVLGRGALLRWSQSYLTLGWVEAGRTAPFPPRSQASLTWLQPLGPQWDMALLLSSRDAMAWRDSRPSQLGGSTRLDVRLSRQFQWQGHRGEATLSVQNLNGDQEVFVPRRYEERRAFASLRLGF